MLKDGTVVVTNTIYTIDNIDCVRSLYYLCIYTGVRRNYLFPRTLHACHGCMSRVWARALYHRAHTSRACTSAVTFACRQQFMDLTTHTYAVLEHAQLSSTWHNWMWSKGVADKNTVLRVHGVLKHAIYSAREGKFSQLPKNVNCNDTCILLWLLDLQIWRFLCWQTDGHNRLRYPLRRMRAG